MAIRPQDITNTSSAYQLRRSLPLLILDRRTGSILVIGVPTPRGPNEWVRIDRVSPLSYNNLLLTYTHSFNNTATAGHRRVSLVDLTYYPGYKVAIFE